MVKSQNFHVMRGHVADGQKITTESGQVFELKRHIKGWMVHGDDGLAVSSYLASANEVEYFVVNGLATQ